MDPNLWLGHQSVRDRKWKGQINLTLEFLQQV